MLPSLSRAHERGRRPRAPRRRQRLRELLAAYERQRDLILLGAYQRGADPLTDRAIAAMDAINAFLRQRTDESAPFEQTKARLRALVD